MMVCYLNLINFDVSILFGGFQIFKGDAQMPKWLSPGAQNMIRRILDPNPVSRITMAGIKADEWFKQGYNPSNPDDEEDIFIDDEAFSLHEVV
jgi:5'-AMP-activated protein kinase catalytic alpha subunit